MSEKRIIAEFVPQAWVNDYAVTVDPEGETEFDVTDRIVAMGREAALKIKDDDYPSDHLRDLAPEELDVFQAALTAGTLRALFDECPLTDLTVAEKVKTLLEKGFLTAAG
mgnify:CR=1 FL=1